MPDTFNVRNAEIEADLKDIGRLIAASLPPTRWGFMLMVFEYGQGGSTFYISNARRDDMLRTLAEFIERQQHEQLEQQQKGGKDG